MNFIQAHATRFLVATMRRTPDHKDLDGVEEEAEELIKICAGAASAVSLIRPNANLVLEKVQKTRRPGHAHFYQAMELTRATQYSTWNPSAT